ncbi:hypothetical protein ACOSQ2_012688 [Xanthoceras sorbifolium]
MASSGAADMVLGCVFNGSLLLHDLTIERRPYHKNCSCALHDLKGTCSNTCLKKNNLSFHKKQVWSSSSENHQYSLSLSASKGSSESFLINGTSTRTRDDGNSLLNS